MAEELVMPRLSDSMEEGTILKWMVSEGDEISRGQEICEIETDKANMTYESDLDGTLIEILAEEGDTLPIGEVIGRVGDPEEAEASDEQQDEGDAGEAEGREEAEDDPEAGHDAEASGQDEREAEAASAEQDEDDEQAQQQTATASGEQEDERGEQSRDGAGASADGGGDGAAPALPAPIGEGGERVKASPLARRIAADQGIDLTGLEGSGPGGRIIRADVEQAADGGEPEAEQAPEREAQPAGQEGEPDGQRETAKGSAEVVELTKMQRTVSRRMAESKATVPHFYLETEVDMTEAVKLRSRLKELAGEDERPPSFNDMVIKACARALREHPRANGAYKDGQFELYSRVNIGMAVAARDTLVVPTVFDADHKSLGEIARATRELAEKVREKKISPPELSGGTFTVSNLGMFGIDNFAAVINPPQAAILAVGELAKKAVVDERGQLVARDRMRVNLACDHRILYGADGAQFLATVRELLEQPLKIAL